jgi:hypothetical protein
MGAGAHAGSWNGKFWMFVSNYEIRLPSFWERTDYELVRFTSESMR